ncbi:endothelin-converting enzyme 1 isoform X2 [Nematostella vectensis]|uniref:endothelin-converting enzyme 1 isoform X2 n=1 Tax=Nematostella vectensis TaxID=45351 RepID=UPI0020774391|nr:endothelin-converting enzyme 1 isoform X2 [Nematostella vectensis]
MTAFAFALVLAASLVTFSKGQHPLEYVPNKQVCCSEACLQMSQDLVRSLDPSVDPCVDFYSYACGGWVKSNPVPKDTESWDKWRILDIEVTTFMKKTVKDKGIRARYSKVEAINKAFDFYDSCMYVPEAQDGRGLLLGLVDKYVRWPPLYPDWNQSSFDLVEVLSAVNRDLNIDPFFSTMVESDLKNSTNNMITLKQTFVGGLFHGQLTRNTPNAKHAREVYRNTIANLTALLGLNDTAKRYALADEILNIEMAAGEISRSFNGYNEQLLYGRYKISEFNELTSDGSIDWLQYINLLYKGTGHKVKADQEIIAYDLPFFSNMTKFLGSLSKRSLMTYMGWIIILRNYENLGKKYIQIREEFKREAFGFGSINREALCFARFTNEFAMPLSRIFVDARFKGNSKQLAEELTSQIKEVFIERLKQNKWMSRQSKNRAIEKANYMTQNIGYPDYILNDKLLDKEFERVIVDKSSFFNTMISMNANFKRKEYLTALKPVDIQLWIHSPLLVNAAYEPTMNKMTFPAAYLQPPFYDQSYPRAMSFGGIGSIMAHELIHGFDNEGKDFDKYGNNIKWWSDKTDKSFVKNVQCLVEQYNNITFMGEKVDGKLTLPENIADNGGLAQSYQAYRQWRLRNGEEKLLPGVMLSNDQVFFISFARNWCKSYKSALYAFDPFSFSAHAPNPVRVNATLQNSEEFSRVFKCPVGSPMNPGRKCYTW